MLDSGLALRGKEGHIVKKYKFNNVIDLPKIMPKHTKVFVKGN